MLKKIVLLLLLLIGAKTMSFAQLGVDFQFSGIPFIGFNYEIKDRYKPELRLGTDNYFEDVSVEIIATYDILNKENYELYAGLGGHFISLSGLVIPVGLYMHPFQDKNFGFVFEVAPVFGDISNLLRGSFGFSYKFDVGKKKGIK